MNTLAKAGIVIVATAAAVGGVVTATSASQDNVPPGARNEALRLGEQIDGLHAAGLTDDNPKVQTLRKEQADLLAETKASEDAAQANEAPPPADSSQDDGAERGPVPCEPLPPYTDGVDLSGARCVSVPTSAGASLFVFLLPRGQAFVAHLGDSSTPGKAAGFEQIPTMPGLAKDDVKVTGNGHIVVTGPSDTRDIDTSIW